MSKGFDEAVANAMLDTEFGAAGAGTLPDPLYVGLSIADPGINGVTFTEPGGGIGYARQSVANDLTNWGAAGAGNPPNVDGETSNNLAIPFGTATGSWGTVTHWGLFSASSGGAPLVWGELDVARTVNNNDQLQFGPNEIKIKLQNQ